MGPLPVQAWGGGKVAGEGSAKSPSLRGFSPLLTEVVTSLIRIEESFI